MTKPGGTGAKKRILAVDDAAISLQRIREALEGYYDVITVNSGTRALRYLEMERPELILLDIRMAPKDGIQTLREIRAMENGAGIPVIMMTGLEGKEGKEYVRESVELGICDYLLKPFSPSDLMERIGRALESRESGGTQTESEESE